MAQFLGKEMLAKAPLTLSDIICYFGGAWNWKTRYAQELARHKNIDVTQRYTHLSNDELDKAYYEVFEKRAKPTKS